MGRPLKAVHHQSVAVLLLLAVKCISAFELTVLHTNDLHSRFDEVTASGANCKAKLGCFGGVARIKYVADSIRKSHPNTVFLNGGDLFQVKKRGKNKISNNSKCNNCA